MTPRAWVLTAIVLSVVLAPRIARAQEEASEPGAARPETSGPLLIAGAGFVVEHINCQLCEHDFPYRRGTSVLGSVGYRVARRAYIAGEVFWIPAGTTSGRVRTLHVDAMAQYRPWTTRGLFVKGGAGMAFVRNWTDVPGSAPVTSKALSVLIGAGWEFRPAARVGYQVFAVQHATALGDVRTAFGDVQNVLGNSWSVGAALLIR